MVLGNEAKVEAPEGRRLKVWETYEPSERGFEGKERLRLVRDAMGLTEPGKKPLRPSSRVLLFLTVLWSASTVVWSAFTFSGFSDGTPIFVVLSGLCWLSPTT